MKKLLIISTMMFLGTLLFAGENVNPPSLIPLPASWQYIEGKFVGDTLKYDASDAVTKNARASMQRHFDSWNLSEKWVNAGKEKSNLFFTIDETLKDSSAYRLDVAPEKIVISAKASEGFFYGVQTLAQYLKLNRDGVFELPCIRIQDAPSTPLRGFLHDVGRNFQDIDALKRDLERLSHYKINLFQWHLTDNPAWRAESRRYPQLKDAKFHRKGRDEGKFYSFKEMHDLIQFAKERHIMIIPELDMPGHSQYFEPTFGCKMYSEKGMNILESLLNEFCDEFSREECPIIHIGTDEVNIPNPQEFMKRMSSTVKSRDRGVMIWDPGLANDGSMIAQVWRDNVNIEETTQKRTVKPSGIFDSAGGYLNGYDPSVLVRKHFFYKNYDGDRAVGAILCCWPDIRVGDKSKIALHSPVWPGVFAFSESTWHGRPQHMEVIAACPSPSADAGKEFSNFEKRMEDHLLNPLFLPYHKLFPFPYQAQSDIGWKVSFLNPLDSTLVLDSKTTYGGMIAILSRNRADILFPDIKLPPKTPKDPVLYVLAEGVIVSESDREIECVIGFEAPSRSNRQYAGIPQQGMWCAFGGDVTVNRSRVPPPVWTNPGTQQYLQPTWHRPANEIPIEDEELPWARPPVKVKLKKGENLIQISAVRGYPQQSFQFTFIPVVKHESGLYVRDHSVRILPGK